MSAKIDPELSRQLHQAAARNENIEAVVRLQAEAPDQIVPDPSRVSQLAQTVLKRVQTKVGRQEQQSHVFSHLGYFVVKADKDFIERLLEEPEVATAIANRQPEAPSPKAPPVKRSGKAVSKRSAK